METKRYIPHILIIVALAVASVMALLMPEPARTGEAGIRTILPDTIGDYTGHDLHFCQNDQCLRSFLTDELDEGTTCPVCSATLDGVSLAERKILPADTGIVRKVYISPDGDRVTVSIVLSGADQKSIHRPEQCLPAQGFTIDRSETIAVELPDRLPLLIRLLSVRRTLSGTDRETHRLSSYSYWFVGKGRETPYHLQRLYWMSADRVLRNISHRWAYVSVAMDRDDSRDTHVEKVAGFISVLHSLLGVGDSE